MEFKNFLYLIFAFIIFFVFLYKFIIVKIENEKLKEEINRLNMEILKYKGKF